jgi:hypothetical protein
MSTDFASAAEDPWNNLQEPARSGRESTAPLLRLLAALDTGWQVEEPIYLRSHWGGSGTRAYFFILHRQPQETPRLITVPANTAVDQFVRNEGLKVMH